MGAGKSKDKGKGKGKGKGKSKSAKPTKDEKAKIKAATKAAKEAKKKGDSVVILKSSALREVPKPVLKSKSIVHLDVSDNVLEALPAKLCTALPKLEHLDISGNRLKSVDEAPFAGGASSWLITTD